MMSVGAGKSAIAFIIELVDLMPSLVSVKPPNSTSSWPKTNFPGLNMMPLLAQC